MERPAKRPRLSLFDRSSVGPDYDDARHNNDMALKSRFESIFEKYTQDFTGIGDEVDIITGEIVVNNGHLERMETETDAGISDLAGDFTSAGRSMLRAMTVTLNPDLPGPDDVLASIETIAEHAVMADSVSDAESEDDLFDTSRPHSQSRSPSNAIEQDWLDTSIEPYNSDTDSLFEENTLQPASPDPLFEESAFPTGEQSPIHALVRVIPYSTKDLNEDDQILAKFGPHVGKEVLNLIGQRQEAHIEPAWRIPVKLARHEARQSSPRITSSPIPSGSPERRRSKSLWRLPAPARRQTSRRSTSVQSDREESVDPLQEDFHSDVENEDSAPASEEFEPSNSGSEWEHDDAKDNLIHVANTGQCPYCHINFGNKSGVMAHWDRWLRQPPRKVKKDDPHDMEFLRKVRSTALIRRRPARLVVYDFRTMVELHEGAGMTFDEIAASKTLRTRKTGLQLQGIYNSHRSPFLGDEDSSGKSRTWSKHEEETLQKMCKNPLMTMATLQRGLKDRDVLEIGDRLAEIWLAKLGVTGGKDENRAEVARILNPDHKAKEPFVAVGTLSQKQTPSQSSVVKREESEDALFE